MQLEETPPGFHVDELGTAVSIQCLVTEGKTGKGNKSFPILFDNLSFGTPKPPTYIYPAMAWTKVFGFSIASFRGFIAFVVLLTIIGLFFLSWQLFGISCAACVLLLATLSPWGWIFSRIAFESMMGPMYMVWGVFIFLRSQKWKMAFLSGFFLAAAMYSYPPMRLTVPLLILSLLTLRIVQKEFSWKYVLTLFSVMTVLLIPLAHLILTANFMVERYNQVSITSEEFLTSIGKKKNVWDVWTVFVTHYFRHFDIRFLVTPRF